jgi:NAD(P)-dependent dehydrogenase (short-subunit alcohol dehydrogenase family)
MTKWMERDIPPQQGKTVAITGANSGIGLMAARMLAAKGARVLMACRDQTKGTQAIDTILGESKKAQVELFELDLASLKSVERCARQLERAAPKLDLLINNAGVMAIPYRTTAEGFEMQFGTNHLGHFALTMQLLPAIYRAAAPRIVNVASLAHRLGTIRFDDLNWEKRYSRWGAYGMSKLANLLFTYELDRKLREAGSQVLSVACHPGYAATDLQLVAARMDNAPVAQWVHGFAAKLFAQSADFGALPTVYAACAPEVKGGQYFGPNGLLQVQGYPTLVQSNSASKDEAVAAELWAVSEQLTHTRFAV